MVKSSAVMQQPDPWRLDRNWAATVTDDTLPAFTLCFLEAGEKTWFILWFVGFLG